MDTYPGRVNYVRPLSLYLDGDISITKVLRAIERCQDLRSHRICLVTVPRFQGRAKCNEERMGLLRFKRPTALAQIRTEVYRLSPLKKILRSLRCNLLYIKKGGFGKALRKSSRIDSHIINKSNGSAGR